MEGSIRKDYSKYFLITAVALVIAAYFPVKLSINPEMAPISGIFIILMSLPCYAALIAWLGFKKSLTLIFILSIYALFIETIAIITGFPYSNFHYTNLIGFKLLGYTPYTVPFAYVPLFLGCFYIASLNTIEKWKIIILTTFLVLVADMVLDPSAVALKFWVYESQGIFYGVPLMNFMGWILTGLLSSLITMYFLKDHINNLNKPNALISSLFLILSFWSAVCLYLGLIFPCLIGFIFVGYILYETHGRVGQF
jgi:bisanhydrobacterioruberin hydratase